MSFEATDARALLYELPEALLITSLQGEILFVNGALERMTGYAADELIGENVSRLMPSPERRRVQAMEWFARWAEDPDTEQLRYLNLEAVTRDGEIRLVSVRVSRHSEGDDSCFVVVLRDVTSEHESVAAMRHAQLVTNRILAIGEDGVLSVDEGQRITYWNPGAERLFGYSEDEALGSPLAMLLPQGLDARHSSLVEEFKDGKASSRLMGERGEIVGRHKDGHEIPLEASITKTTIDGQTVLSAQVRDITERKRAEEALRASEARFRAIFENAVEGMALLSPDGRVLEINAAAREMVSDYEPGRMFWELNWWGPDADDDGVMQSRENLKANVENCARGESIRARVSLRGTDDAMREIDFSLIPVAVRNGEVTYIIAEGRDITSVA